MDFKEQEIEEVDQLVFTYGTLKFGWGNYNSCIKPFIEAGTAEYIGALTTEPKFKMLSLGGFPGVLPKGDTPIKGDLFRIKSKACLSRLDRLEGHYGNNNPSNLYNTVEINTEFGPALMYTINERYADSCPVVESGEWTKNQRYN